MYQHNVNTTKENIASDNYNRQSMFFAFARIGFRLRLTTFKRRSSTATDRDTDSAQSWVLRRSTINTTSATDTWGSSVRGNHRFFMA